MKTVNQKTISRTLLVFALVLCPIGLALYQYCGEPNYYGPPADSALSIPGVANQSSPAGDETSSGTPRLHSNTASQPGDERSINTLIKGTVKRAGSEQPIGSAVVVLFVGDKRGANAQPVDTSGQFQFKEIPIRPGTTYSLQTKLPGLCGEDSFTFQDVDARRSISKDLILKPCQSQSLVPSPTNTEDPQLASITDRLSGMRVSLDSIRASFTTLVIVGIAITTVLLAMAGLVILSRRFAIDDRARIDDLYEWRQSIEPHLKKLPQLQESAVGVLQLPAELEQTLQQLLKALDKKASDSLPKKESAGASLEQKSTGQVKEERGQVVTALNDQLEVKGSSQRAIEWYRSLLLNKTTSPNPLYLSINFPLTDRSAMSVNRRICLNEIPHQGPFVLFRESDDARVGWIFPNPASNFAPDHKWVFTHLNQANFEQQKAGISPRKLQFQEGLWLLAL